MSYVARANKYARDVVAGRVVACKWVKLACSRQLNDLRSRSKAYPYKFDRAAAERVCEFIEALPHVKGVWAQRRETIKLEPWQCFILTTVFGWINKKTGYRRFRTTYIEVPRKNAKSSISSGVALYMLLADGEEGAEVYSAATQRDQARIVFGDALAMVNRSEDMREHLGVETSKYAVYQPATNSSFRALCRDQSGNLDGLSVHCAIVDELHGHKTRGTWDVLLSGIGARSQPLLWAITTAGFNRSGVCYEQHSYTRSVLENKHSDDSFFGIIYTIDQDDDWRLPSTWKKANPNYDISVNPESLRVAAKKAERSAASLNNFLTKHLCVWVNADSAWMNMTAWDKCADPTLDESDFAGDPCYIAADLASKNDFSSVARLYKRKQGKHNHYYVFCTHYINSDRVEDASNDAIAGWAADGLITVTQGSTTDFSVIESDLEEAARNLEYEALVLDPYQAAMLRQNLIKNGIKAEEYSQNLKNMSEPTHELEALVLSGRLHHTGDPVLAWMVGNVVAHTDAKGRIFPKRDRTQPAQKIDGAIATIMALGRSMQGQKDDKNEIEPQIFVFSRKR